MNKILLLGNPNVGKTTLFNSLTKSSEHTGNFHGVTVEGKSKIVKYLDQEYEFVDLPGIYSLNTFSCEEEVSKNAVLKQNGHVFLIVDANSLRRNLYIAQQLNELEIDYQILINNYDYFKAKKNKINVEKLQKILNKNIYIINAKKIKLKEFINFIKPAKTSQLSTINYLDKYLIKIQEKLNLDKKKIISAFNGDFSNLNSIQISYIQTFFSDIIIYRYSVIDSAISECVFEAESYIYGESKLDKLLLKPWVMIPGFFLTLFVCVYLIFFLVGPILSDGLNIVYEKIVVQPIGNFLLLITDNVWIIELISGGVFSSVSTILMFIPQICLLFMFLTLLEESGLLARMCYIFDDFLTKLGLNGKAIYIQLLGLGCNTMSCMACRNMSDKNMRKKMAITGPYISCMARLPIYIIIASTFFGKMSYLIITGLYLLGIFLSCFVAYLLNRKKLKTIDNSLLLEFPPMRRIDIKHIMSTGRKNAIELFKRIFATVLMVGVIIWILSHTEFNLKYTDTINDSILFFFVEKIAFIFAPIGLNNAGVVSALVVGILAKELVLSTFSISNNVYSNSMLKESLLLSTSVINFSRNSAISFLIFFSIYAPCLSNLAVMKKEVGRKSMLFSLVSQLLIAYLLSFVVFNGLNLLFS